MKYIFHIHSNINLLASVLIVENEKIKRKDVLFLLARGVKTDFEVNKEDIPAEVYYHSFNVLKELKTLQFLKNSKIVEKIDDLIKGFINGDDFIYYCPNSRGPLYRAFFSHDKCSGVNYIEDGMDAYLSREGLLNKFPKKVPAHIRLFDATLGILPVFCNKRLGYMKGELYSNIKKNNTSNIYSLSDKAFKNQINENIEVLKIGYKSHYNYDYKWSNVFVFDAVVEQKVVKEKDFYSFVNWFCSTYYNDVNETLAIKFHPHQGETEISQILKIFEKNKIETKVISNDVSMEVVFMINKKTKVFGIGSSLLLYASLFGIKDVHVLYPYFEIEKKYKSPRLIFWNDVFLKESNCKLLTKTI
ncbi:MAG: hypothetical protein HRT66_10645 [Flavobacteriaceae bacterium]|nr:hypothetical protein [Flavobacteriaceae bacterium]